MTLFVAALSLIGCGDREEHPRCARCGMRVDTAPAWLAGHGEARFDGPKCLFRWASDESKPLGDAWVTEYYGATRLPWTEAHFVVGSDVLSPMGDDLVPLRDGAEAARFAADHGGRAVSAAEVDEALIASLDRR
ncbi:MAG: nitrous oxide reductase accessory protein NosL [Myxococcales bacterium]|nr:nitrous oxide reductase accessory protein NosL [Myxococcales bacterium]